VKVLAWIFIVSSLFIAIPGLCLLIFPGILMAVMNPPPPFLLTGPLFLAIALTFISIPLAILSIGVGLLRYRDWARILAVIVAAFLLIAIPFGTAIGIYAFWVLLSVEGSRSYKRGPSPEGRGWHEVPG